MAWNSNPFGGSSGMSSMSNYANPGPWSGGYGTGSVASSAVSAPKLGGMDFLGMGMQILGGFLSQRNQRKEDRMSRQLQRESMMAQRAGQRESLIGSLYGQQADMQSRQDDYARTIQRNRNAISPWAAMNTDPRLTTGNADKPIYNPLTDPGHIYNQIGGWRQGLMDNPVAPPPTMQHPWRG